MSNILHFKPDITSDIIKDNETWNTCSKCHKDWKDLVPTPGLLHQTKLCYDCKEFNKYMNIENKNINFKEK